MEGYGTKEADDETDFAMAQNDEEHEELMKIATMNGVEKSKYVYYLDKNNKMKRGKRPTKPAKKSSSKKKKSDKDEKDESSKSGKNKKKNGKKSILKKTKSKSKSKSKSEKKVTFKQNTQEIKDGIFNNDADINSNSGYGLSVPRQEIAVSEVVTTEASTNSGEGSTTENALVIVKKQSLIDQGESIPMLEDSSQVGYGNQGDSDGNSSSTYSEEDIAIRAAVLQGMALKRQKERERQQKRSIQIHQWTMPFVDSRLSRLMDPTDTWNLTVILGWRYLMASGRGEREREREREER